MAYIKLFIQWVIKILFLFIMISVSSYAIPYNKIPLSAGQAFKFSVMLSGSQQITAHWQIAPHHYLYRDRIRFSFEPNMPVTIHFPVAEVKQLDEATTQVYSGKLSIPIDLQTTANKIKLRVEYQGCSTEKFCYPPIQHTILLDLSTKRTVTTSSQPIKDNIDKSISQTATRQDVIQPKSLGSLLTDQRGVTKLFESYNLLLLLLMFMGLGLLLAFTPCVLPMIPILMSIILGQKKPLNTKKAFMLSLSYVLGSAIIYAFAGMLAAIVGSSLQAWLQKPWIIAATSGLFVLLALSLFGLYDLHPPKWLHRRIAHMSNKQQAGTYFGVFSMGMISSLIVSPCVTAPLVGVLLYISHTGDLLLGATALFVMGVGMGMPLLVIGTSAGKLLPKSGPWMVAVKKVFGILMLAMAIWLLSRVISENTAMFLWLMLLLGIAIFFSFYLPRLLGRHILNRSFAIILGFASIVTFLMISGIIPPRLLNVDLTQKININKNLFTIVRDSIELKKELNLAQAQGRPVILDFYADWCESCIIMDRNVFQQPEVQRVLTNFVLLRVDLTANTAADEAILKTYNVIAPPTVLFFNAQGQEINSQRIVGEVNAKEFLTRVDNIGIS